MGTRPSTAEFLVMWFTFWHGILLYHFYTVEKRIPRKNITISIQHLLCICQARHRMLRFTDATRTRFLRWWQADNCEMMFWSCWCYSCYCCECNCCQCHCYNISCYWPAKTLYKNKRQEVFQHRMQCRSKSHKLLFFSSSISGVIYSRT